MLQKNGVVLYKNQCALVIGTDGEKYVIALRVFSGKKTQRVEVKVREKDVVALHPGPAANLEPLLDFSDSAIPLQIAEVHELLISDESTARAPVALSELAELMRSSFKAEESYALYSALCACDEFALDDAASKTGKIAFVPRSAEEMAALKQKKYEKEHAVELRAAFIKRLKQRKLDLPRDSSYMTEVESLALGQTEKSKVMAEAGIAQTPEKAHKLLLDTGMWRITRNPFPTRYGFSFASAKEGLPPPPDEARLSVETAAYAIDNAWSADPDDAVSWDGTYLWIHIADPASAVMPESSIDKAARARGTTLYLPEGASRMLAETSLADYALGLNEKSRALSFRMQFDEKGAIRDCAVIPTMVNVKRLTYKEADEKKESSELAPLFMIARRNEARRKNAGAVAVDLPEVHITVDEATKKVSIEREVHYESASMVREMMLLAGEGAAHFAFKNGIPFPYVSQEAPDIPKDIPTGLAGDFKLLRCMRKRSVGITPAPHAAIGAAMYSQVTSPLRRYGDLIAHEQLRAFLANRPLIDKDDMLMRISEGDAAAGAARKASRESETHWKLVYLLQNPEWSGEAVCVDKKDRQVQLYIPQLNMQSFIVPKQDVQFNDVLTVRSANIDIPNQKVDFIPV
ncbi:MAG: RNB domain-containing ribonuclease [Treponema sp.]|nr:RNB domain-containing ribonuclease [Treponema sp.]